MTGIARKTVTVSGFGGAVFLTACALIAPEPGPKPADGTTPVEIAEAAEPSQSAISAAPSVTPETVRAEAALSETISAATEVPTMALSTPTAPRTAVVVSDDIPEYTHIVAEILGRGLEGVSVYDLDGLESNAPRILAAVQAGHPDRLIAIGLLAATVARDVPATPMVFCQVYNYLDHDLISPISKGIHLLPPFDRVLRKWRSLAPDLERIGIITGPGQDALLNDIRAAADAAGVTLAVRTVQSDRETLLALEELVPEIQGLYLLPDNRILSPDAVRQILSYSVEHDRQLAVFGETLLDMGALLGITNNPGDVVDRVLARLEDVDADGRLQGPDMLPLTQANVAVNRDVAQRLGLSVSEQLAASR